MTKSCRGMGLRPQSATEGDHAREGAEGCLGEELVGKCMARYQEAWE